MLIIDALEVIEIQDIEASGPFAVEDAEMCQRKFFVKREQVRSAGDRVVAGQRLLDREGRRCGR